jgi:hypothetical protein
MKPCLMLAYAFLMMVVRSPAICVPDPIQAPAIEGYLLLSRWGGYVIPAKAKVHVTDKGKGRKLLASVDVDNGGHFIVKGIKPGMYLLSGHSPKLISAYVDIKVIKENAGRHLANDSLIFIVLGEDALKQCGGSSITIKSKENIDEMLRNSEREQFRD